MVTDEKGGPGKGPGVQKKDTPMKIICKILKKLEIFSLWLVQCCRIHQ